MADTAASVLARLKNKGKETGRSYQLCLQLFCQEEFLRRLEKSQYAENLVLKGGLFIYSITGYDSRDSRCRFLAQESSEYTGKTEKSSGRDYCDTNGQ